MAFKMKGPSLYPNFRGKKEKMIVINHEGPAGAADGRASSSPFQRKTGGKTKEQLLKEGFTPRDADQMIKDGATTGRQKAKAKPKSQQDFVPAYPGADISKAEYDKAKKAGVKSESEYAEYKAKMKKKKSPAKIVKRKGDVKRGRSETPGPIVADTRVSRKTNTSKSIGPSESPKAIAAKRDKMRSERRKAEKSNPKEFMPETEASRKAEKDYKKASSFAKMKHGKSPMKGYKSAAQRKAVHASKADGGAGNPNKKKKK